MSTYSSKRIWSLDLWDGIPVILGGPITSLTLPFLYLKLGYCMSHFTYEEFKKTHSTGPNLGVYKCLLGARAL